MDALEYAVDDKPLPELDGTEEHLHVGDEPPQGIAIKPGFDPLKAAGVRMHRTPREQVDYNQKKRRCGSCTRCAYADGALTVVDGEARLTIPCAWRGGLFTSDMSPHEAKMTIRVLRMWPDLPPLFVVEFDKPHVRLANARPKTRAWLESLLLGNAVAVMHKGELLELLSADLLLQDEIRARLRGKAETGEELPVHPSQRGPVLAE